MSYQPMSLHDFVQKFATPVSCQEAIIARRWPSGWKCPACGSERHYHLRTRRVLQCAASGCRKQCSITRGTVFEQLKMPLPKIFLGLYLMTDKQGISALSLSKHLDVAYDTAFALLHKLRRAMADHDLVYALSGTIQVDESYVGGHGDQQHRRGRARDSKQVVAIAVEQRGLNQSGFIHLDILPSASRDSLHGMILEKIKPGAVLLTDAWKGYCGIGDKGYQHAPVVSPGGKQACSRWPLVHRAISNFTRWLLGTHRQFCQLHLDAYAAEFCWRTNRRNMAKADYNSNARELLLPDRLLTLACTSPHHTAKQLHVQAA